MAMTPAFRLPAGVAAWTLRHVRVPAVLVPGGLGPPDAEGLVPLDIALADGRIAGLFRAGALPEDAAALPAWHAPGLALPCFVDAHTHLDKGQIWLRAQNPDGTGTGARTAVPLDREARWTAIDVAARMDFALAAAYAHGTAALRTHLDCLGRQTRISWPVFAAAKARWAGRIDLQASPLFGAELALDPAHMADLTAMMAAHGGTCLGAVTTPGPDLEAGLDILFRLAADKGFELDFHADETNDPAVNTLSLIAGRALHYGFSGRILVGHCCTLSLMPEDEMRRTIELVARAGLSIVSLPMCNLYLQDRGGPGRTPRWRGITAIKELEAAGVNVMVASDNTRDPFYAYGDLDMLEVWREATRIAQLDHPFGAWAEAVTSRPARALGREPAGRLSTGAPADLVVLPARSLSELMARPTLPRTVIRAGRPIEAMPAAYAALDGLEGLRV